MSSPMKNKADSSGPIKNIAPRNDAGVEVNRRKDAKDLVALPGIEPGFSD